MRFIERLCSPAFFYLILVALSVGIDVSIGYVGVAAVKALVGLIMVVILNSFCSVNLSIVSWAIVAAPFVVLVLATAISVGHNMHHPLIERFSLTPAYIELDSENASDLAGDDLPVSTDL